ncbi:hypothetical protein FIU91_16715 [Roseivivax sp. THAF30]|nr:hypothetical protein FIU91_16715 [Roseivivax sp. THAF30]
MNIIRLPVEQRSPIWVLESNIAYFTWSAIDGLDVCLGTGERFELDMDFRIDRIHEYITEQKPINEHKEQ